MTFLSGHQTLRVKETFGDNFKFLFSHPFDNISINEFHTFYKDTFLNWKQYLPSNPETLFGILTQCL